MKKTVLHKTKMPRCPKTVSRKHGWMGGVRHNGFDLYGAYTGVQHVAAYYEERKCRYCGLIDDAYEK